MKWKVVELWTLPAEELLAGPSVGIVPWVPLAQRTGPPEVLLQRCRDRIEREGGKQTANLLAVSQVFARLHFDKPEWLEILGGSRDMIESPLIQEIVAESRRKSKAEDISSVLQARFGPVGPAISAGLVQVKKEDQLQGLIREAATCASIQQFEKRLHAELSAPPPVSTRGKRRPRKPAE